MKKVAEMTNAEFLVHREHLGFSIADLALILGVQERAILRWEDAHRIPDEIADWLRKSEEVTAELARREVARLSTEDEPVIKTFASDSDFSEAFPGSQFTASWHRAMVARVVRQLPDVRVEYA